MEPSLPIQLQPSNLRPLAYRVLSKKHGLNIHTDGLAALTAVVGQKFGVDWKGPQCLAYLEDIARVWKSEDRGLFIDRAGLEEVVKQLADGARPSPGPENPQKDEDSLDWRQYFKVLNPPQQPHYAFDKSRRQFSLVQDQRGLAAFRNADVNYFGSRYHLIRDRLSRNENFQKKNYTSISTMMKSDASNEITLIKNIIGRDGQKFILFGLLGQNAAGRPTLEDSTDVIELNLDQALKSPGSFYTLGMFVVVEGIYSQTGTDAGEKTVISGMFYVSNMGHPPAEKRDVTLETYGHLDFTNINNENIAKLNHISKVNKGVRRKLVQLERSLDDHRLVVLGSNCHLDQTKVLQGLKKFFGRLEASLEDDEPPIALVMIGPFISKPITSVNSSISNISNTELYKNNFDNFTTIVLSYPSIVSKVKFILIPGANDPWQSTYSLGSTNLNYAPQAAIPTMFLNRLERVLPKGHLILGWNPVRVSYLSQEIVIVKDELVSKLKRNDMVFKTDNVNGNENKILGDNLEDNVPPRLAQARKLVKTLLDQGTLQPFSSDLKLVNPMFDFSLRLEPLPHLIILNDAQFGNFDVTYNGCKVVNLAGLVASGRKLNYMEYVPAKRSVSFKEVFF